MPFDTKFEFILQFEKILADMKRKSPETYGRNLLFLSIENMETVRSILHKFFPLDKPLIETLTRKDVDLMLLRILRSEVVGLQGEGEKLVRKAKTVINQFGFLPPVEFFYAYNGAELFDAMLERIYRNLKKKGRPQSLSEIWRRFASPLTASFELKNIFTKDLLFKIRQRLKNYLDKDPRVYLDARSPKKLYVALTEWGDKVFD